MNQNNMHNRTTYSDEHLNAFIDDQLDASEKAEILDAARHDSTLSQRICKLQKLHNLVQLSYESIDVPEHHRQKGPKPGRRFGWAIAASLFLFVGSLAGWTGHQVMNPGIGELAQITHGMTAAHNAKHWRLMLHVSTDNPNRLNLVLDEAEALLREYAASSRLLELEILTHKKGLALVTNNGEDYSQRLEKLKQQYANLSVLVCGQTLKRVQKERGQKVELIPGTNVVKSAINEVVKRQRDGWSYIKI